jgi:hypothetical protein
MYQVYVHHAQDAPRRYLPISTEDHTQLPTTQLPGNRVESKRRRTSFIIPAAEHVLDHLLLG